MRVADLVRRSIVAGVFNLGVFTSFAVADGKVKIGVPVPLTGNAAAYGTDIKNALEFANKRIAGGVYELIVEDDQCSDKEAVSIAQKLTHVDKVDYALGFGCSGTVLSSAPVYEKAKTLVIASGTGAPAITDAGDYIFRTKPSLSQAADLLAKDIASKFKKVGVITEETAYCQGLTGAFTKAATALGVEVSNENFLTGVDDFRSTLLKFRQKGIEAVFLNPQGEPAMVQMYKQYRALDWKAPVYGTFLPGSPAFLQAFGKDADGVVYADLAFNEDMLNDEGIELLREFEREYGKPKSAEHYSALSIVAFSTLHDAIKSGKQVKEYLYSTTFHGVADGYGFDKNGDVVSDKLRYALKSVKNGTPARYGTAE